MQRILTTILVLLTAAMLTGMGNLGGAPEGAVPKTEENIKAQVVDHTGVSTELEWVSIDGKVFIEGRRGEGQMNVLFRDLKEVGFGQVSGENVSADLLLKSGSRQEIKVRKNAILYGDTGYGAYRILAQNISRIVFHK